MNLSAHWFHNYGLNKLFFGGLRFHFSIAATNNSISFINQCGYGVTKTGSHPIYYVYQTDNNSIVLISATSNNLLI